MQEGTRIQDSGDTDNNKGVDGAGAKDGTGQADTQAFGLPKVRRGLWPFKFSLVDNRWYVNKAVKRSVPDTEALM